MRVVVFVAVALSGLGGAAGAAEFPKPVEGRADLKGFRFATGDTLDVQIHYRPLGQPERDKDGNVRNAVLVLHGTGGAGANFVGDGSPTHGFAGELFGKGQPLDAERYYIVIPDNLGHGRSTKPSDGLHARF